MEDRVDPARALLLPFGQHAGDRLALQVRLGAAEGAGDDRERPRPGVAGDLPLRHIAERPDHDVAPVLGQELGRHRLEATAVEEVQEEGLDDVVAVVAEGDLVDVVLAGPAIERAAPEPTAETALGLPGRDHAPDDAVGVLLEDLEGHPEPAQVFGQHVLGKARLLLIEIHRHELELDRRRPLLREQQIEHRVRVLAPRETDHHAIAGLDHAEIRDRLADEPAQPRLQPLEVGGIRRHCGARAHEATPGAGSADGAGGDSGADFRAGVRARCW